LPHPNSTPTAPSCQRVCYPHPFTIQPADLRHNPICPSAATYAGLCAADELQHVFAVCCKRWGCSFCARQKIRQLAAKTAIAQPNRMLTLTLDPKYYLDPKDCWQKTAKLVPELIRKLRPRFGDIEYLRVTELHKSGWPHYHLLIRSRYLPYEIVKTLWEDLTGAIKVDLRQVDKTFSAYWYLTKYLSKLHNKGWTDRHVSTSRNFFRPEKSTPPAKIVMLNPALDPRHPYDYLARNYWMQTATAVTPTHWTTSLELTPAPDDLTNWELGIPKETSKEAPKQRTMISEDN